eukprot:m.14304 g.14304  ORF g.14304 m.14304 type:complete len:52 (-) comp8325_c0_seq1:136-291(-)
MSTKNPSVSSTGYSARRARDTIADDIITSNRSCQPQWQPTTNKAHNAHTPL